MDDETTPTSISHLSTELLLEICDHLPHADLTNLSLVNRSLRYLIRPLLFKYTQICCAYRTEYHPSDGSLTFRRAVDCLSANNALLSDIRRLKFKVDSWGFQQRRIHLPELFALLPRASNLQELRFYLLGSGTYGYKGIISILATMLEAASRICLPNVKRLGIHFNTIGLVACCPNLETLYIGHSIQISPSNFQSVTMENTDLIRDARNLKELKAPVKWVRANAQHIATAFPLLQILRLYDTYGTIPASVINPSLGYLGHVITSLHEDFPQVRFLDISYLTSMVAVDEVGERRIKKPHEILRLRAYLEDHGHLVKEGVFAGRGNLERILFARRTLATRMVDRDSIRWEWTHGPDEVKAVLEPLRLWKQPNFTMDAD